MSINVTLISRSGEVIIKMDKCEPTVRDVLDAPGSGRLMGFDEGSLLYNTLDFGGIKIKALDGTFTTLNAILDTPVKNNDFIIVEK